MLGWEYPPHISGGLGTACEGLTRALALEGVQLTFVLPREFGDEDSAHMQLVSPETGVHVRNVDGTQNATVAVPVEILEIDSVLRPYQTPETYVKSRTEFREESRTMPTVQPISELVDTVPAAGHYGTDLFAEVRRFADLAVQAAAGREFDLIHAHDWMTWPAALAVKHASGKPLIVHVHSLENDRSGEHVNPGIHRIEAAGLHGADHIITVSHFTKGAIVRAHGIAPERISVVHNGVTRAEARTRYHIEDAADPRPMVLFLGRVTYQKGPEFFVRAAEKVLSRARDVRFVLAGSGDMLEPTRKLVHELKLDDSFEFPGFVRGAELERWLTIADCLVMPSRSEPFGIVPLEALAYDTPVIVSRQSGVSEVLQHALKADYWDVNRIAQLILAVIRHGSLSADMLEMCSRDVLRLHWKAAAQKTCIVYRDVLQHLN